MDTKWLFKRTAISLENSASFKRSNVQRSLGVTNAWIKLTAGMSNSSHEVVVEKQEQEEEFNYLVFVQLCNIFDAEQNVGKDKVMLNATYICMIDCWGMKKNNNKTITNLKKS